LAHTATFITERGDERLHGAGVFDFSQRAGGDLAHIPFLILECGDERLHGQCTESHAFVPIVFCHPVPACSLIFCWLPAQATQRFGSGIAHILVFIPQGFDQGLFITASFQFFNVGCSHLFENGK
jgi:hypothetical protein